MLTNHRQVSHCALSLYVPSDSSNMIRGGGMAAHSEVSPPPKKTKFLLSVIGAGLPRFSWILLKQEMMGWQLHQLDHMQIICTTLQIDNNASTTSVTFYRPDAPSATQLTESTSRYATWFARSATRWRRWMKLKSNEFEPRWVITTKFHPNRSTGSG